MGFSERIDTILNWTVLAGMVPAVTVAGWQYVPQVCNRDVSILLPGRYTHGRPWRGGPETVQSFGQRCSHNLTVCDDTHNNLACADTDVPLPRK